METLAACTGADAVAVGAVLAAPHTGGTRTRRWASPRLYVNLNLPADDINPGKPACAIANNLLDAEQSIADLAPSRRQSSG